MDNQPPPINAPLGVNFMPVKDPQGNPFVTMTFNHGMLQIAVTIPETTIDEFCAGLRATGTVARRESKGLVVPTIANGSGRNVVR